MFARVLGRSSRFTANFVASRQFPSLVVRTPVACLHIAFKQPAAPLKRTFSTAKRPTDQDDAWDLEATRPEGFKSDFAIPVAHEAESQQMLEWRKENPQLTFREIVKKYGFYPLAGLATITLLSKEIIPLNEEFLLLLNFAAVLTTLHVAIGDSAWTAINEAIRKEKQKMWDWDQFKIDLVEEKITDVKTRLQLPEVYEEYVREYADAAKELNQFELVKPKHEFRAATLKRLQDILNKEQDASASAKKKLLQDVLAHVRGQVQSRAELRTATIDNAIANLGRRIPFAPSDPVVSLFNDFLKKNGKAPIV